MTIDRNNFPEVSQILRSTWLLNYVRNRIYTLKLSSYLSPEDVIQYVVEALAKTIKSDTKIEYPIAWAKAVSEKYIKKEYRRNRKTQLSEAEVIESLAHRSSTENTPNPFENDEQLHASLDKLKLASKQIILMRFFDELQWEAIAVRLSAQEGRIIHAATARKRGERAIKELRRIYLAA